MSIIEIIKSYIIVRQNVTEENNKNGWFPYDPDEDHPSQLLHEWFCENQKNIANWPDVDTSEEDEEPEMEDVDLENVEFIRLADDLIEVDAGGDWQNPTRMIIELIDGKLTCTSAMLCEDFGDGELSSNQIEEILRIEE